MNIYLDPAILFFNFGAFAGAIKSNLEIPLYTWIANSPIRRHETTIALAKHLSGNHVALYPTSIAF